MTQLVIFDWDGTLCDSLQRIAHCMHLAAEDVGIEPPEPEAVREIVGLGLLEAFRLLFPDQDESLLPRLKESYSQHFVVQDNTPSPFYEGVDEVLADLKSRGFLLAVATGKSRRGLNRVLQVRNMQDFFDSSRCADETRSKPHPLMLEELLSEFSLHPEQAIMVGDTEYDMEMAEQAGMPRIAVNYGAHHVDRLRSYQPLHCADDFFQVGEVILNHAATALVKV